MLRGRLALDRPEMGPGGMYLTHDNERAVSKRSSLV